MDNLKLDKVKAIGHSSGGIVLLYAATMQPERFDAIVPMSAQIYSTPQVRNFIQANAKPGSPSNPNADGEKLHGAEKNKLLERQFYHFHLLSDEPFIKKEELATIKARTLIIHGDNDFVPVSQAYEMFENIPNAHLYIVPNGWHLPQVGRLNGADFMRRTLEFLKGEWNKGFAPK